MLSGSSLLIERARNEARGARKQLEAVEERLQAEQRRRTDLQRERDALLAKLSACGGSSSVAAAAAESAHGPRSLLEAAIDADQRAQPPSATLSARGSRGSSQSPSLSPAAASSRRECSAENPCQLAIELRAQLQLRQSELAGLQAEVGRLSEAISSERAVLIDRAKALEARNAELDAKNAELRRGTPRAASSSSSSAAAESERVRRVKDKWARIVEEEREQFRRERYELVSQLETMRRIVADIHMLNSLSSATPFSPAVRASPQSPVVAVRASRRNSATSSVSATGGETDDDDWTSLDASSTPGLPVANGGGGEPMSAALASVFKGFVAAEETYLQNLATTVELFMKPMQNLPEAVINRQARQAIFGVIEVLQSFHLKQMPIIREAARDPLHTGIGQVFLDIHDFLKMYRLYSQNYETALAIINESMALEPFADFVQKAQARQSCNGVCFQAFLLIPIQRVCSYYTQLRLFRDAIPKESPEFARLEQAFVMLKQQAPSLDEKKKDAEALFRVVDVQRRLLSLPEPLFKSKRRFVHDSAASIFDEKKKRIHERHLFLFTDLLVEGRAHSSSSHSRQSSKREYRFMHSIHLLGVKLRDVPDGELPVGNAIQLSNNSNSYTIICPSDEAKEEWMTRLGTTLEKLSHEERQQRISRLKSKSRTVELAHRDRAGTVCAPLPTVPFVTGPVDQAGSDDEGAGTGSHKRHHKHHSSSSGKHHHRKPSDAGAL